MTRLAEALCEVYDFNPLNFMGKCIKNDARGSSLLGDISDEQSGSLTFNVACVEIDSKQTKIGLDMRIPVTIDKDKLIEKLIKALLPYDLNDQEFDYIAPFYVPLDSSLVTTLLSAYQDITNDRSRPLISGGATFARTMNQCVAFGVMFGDPPDLMHQANEKWELSNMFKAMDIHVEVIYRLCANN